MDKNVIELNSYVHFDRSSKKFIATDKAAHILYREKNIICSYSGIDERTHFFICELINLYSGHNVYNHSLSDIDYAKSFERCSIEDIERWMERVKKEEWFIKAIDMFSKIIEDIPNYE